MDERDTSSVPKQQTRLAKLVTNPWLVLVLAIVTVGSAAFAVYTWRESKASRELVMFLSPTRIEILKKGAVSDLEVAYRGTHVDSDISAVEIGITNVGKLPIRSENILSPISISVGPSSKILDVRLVKAGRELTELGYSPDQGVPGQLNLSWKILEQDDGAIFQVLYAGAANTEISVSGAVEGQRNVEFEMPTKLTRRSLWLQLMALVVMFLSGSFLLLQMRRVGFFSGRRVAIIVPFITFTFICGVLFLAGSVIDNLVNYEATYYSIRE